MMRIMNVVSKRGAAAILTCGLLSAAVLPQGAAAQDSGLTEKDVREIVREELANHRAELEKMISEKLGSSGQAPWIFPGPPAPFMQKGSPHPPAFPGVPAPQAGQGGWLGVMVSDSDGGAAIDEVVEGSPAESAGLVAGDVIVRVGDTDIGSSADLVSAIYSKKPGTKLRMMVLRDGEEVAIPVKLANRQDNPFAESMPPSGMMEHESAAAHEAHAKAEKAAKSAADAAAKAHAKAEKSAKAQADKAAKAEKSAKAKAEKQAKSAQSKAEKSTESDEADRATASGPGFLGVEFGPGPGGEGTAVTGVVGGSPAEKAGIRTGDVLLSINGEAVTADSLPNVVSSLGAGSRVKVKLSRDGNEEVLVLRLGTRDGGGAMAAETAPEKSADSPAALRAPSRTAEAVPEAKPGFLGVETRAIDADARETLGLEADQGVLVQRVVEGSAAEKAGLQRNDLIVSVGGTNVATPDALGQAIREIGAGKEVSLDLIRRGERMSLSVTLGGRD